MKYILILMMVLISHQGFGQAELRPHVERSIGLRFAPAINFYNYGNTANTFISNTTFNEYSLLPTLEINLGSRAFKLKLKSGTRFTTGFELGYYFFIGADVGYDLVQRGVIVSGNIGCRIPLDTEHDNWLYLNTQVDYIAYSDAHKAAWNSKHTLNIYQVIPLSIAIIHNFANE